MGFENLNMIAANTILPVVRFADLQNNTDYMITELKQVDTRFGKRIVAILNGESQTYFPDRIQQRFQANPDELTEAVNTAKSGKLILAYRQNTIFQFKTL